MNLIISKCDRDIGKILFVFGSYEYLLRLEGKIRDGIFFCINKSDNNSVIYEQSTVYAFSFCNSIGRCKSMKMHKLFTYIHGHIFNK